MKNKAQILAFIILMFTNNSFGQQSNNNAPEATETQIKGRFRDIAVLEKAFIDTKPMDRKDGILVGELGIDGGDKNMIVNLARRIGNNHYGIFDSFLIAHKDKLIFESYFTRGRINLAHPQASATKSWTGLALGRAIQLGYLKMDDLNKPVISFLKDLDPSEFVDGVEKITLKHALTMSTGIRISSESKKKINENPDASKGQGEVQQKLKYSSQITKESQVFKYGTGPDFVMQIIEAVVPGSAKDFIKNEVLSKMGITNYDWKINSKTGLPFAGGRVSMTSRDMIKLGILAMNKGKWNDKQLIPEEFMTLATSKILDTGENAVYFGGCRNVANEGYGFFWWNADLKFDNKSYYSSSAQGGGGQFIILIEELDLVIVTTAHNNRYPSTLRMTADNILPAFIK